MLDIIKKINKKRLVFSVTTGRSGTKYLTYILSLLKNVKAEHEAKPAFHEYYRMILNQEYRFKDFWLEKKLPHIASLKESIYCDMSHVACKGFLEPLLELGIKPSLIILRRNKRDVASSLLRLNTIPSRTPLGLVYLNSPEDNNALKLSANINKLTDYQLCYWYTLEIERRQDYYKNVFQNNGYLVTDVNFDDLVSGEGIKQIIKELELPNFTFIGKLKYLKNRKTKVNSKIHEKNNLYSVDFDLEESNINKYLYNEY
jgi:hypothetical protein